MSRAALLLLTFFFSLSNILSQASIIRGAGVILNTTRHIVDIYGEKPLPPEPVKKLRPIDYSKYLKQPNIEALQKDLNQNSLSSKEKADAYGVLFGKNTDTGDLRVDKLPLPSEAIQDVLSKNNTIGRPSFTLEDVIPVGQEIIGGYYKPNEKKESEIRIKNINLGLKKFDEYKLFQTAKSPVPKLLTDFD